MAAMLFTAVRLLGLNHPGQRFDGHHKPFHFHRHMRRVDRLARVAADIRMTTTGAIGSA
jgi:hypothetical protein